MRDQIFSAIETSVFGHGLSISSSISMSAKPSRLVSTSRYIESLKFKIHQRHLSIFLDELIGQ